MTAVLPASAMSKMSARLPGRSRTRSPTFTSASPIRRVSSGVLASSKFHSHSFIVPVLYRWTHSTQDSMELQELFLRQGLGSLQNLPSALVAITHLAFFIFGQGQNSQSENLVDLGAIEQIARAFGCNLRVVVQDDRRRQHRIALVLFSYENRPGPDVFALNREWL